MSKKTVGLYPKKVNSKDCGIFVNERDGKTFVSIEGPDRLYLRFNVKGKVKVVRTKTSRKED